MHRNPVGISRSVLESEWCPGLPGVTSRKKQLPPGDLPSSQSLLAPTGAMHTPPTGPSSGWTWCQWPRFSKSSEEPTGSTGVAERLYNPSAQRTSVPTKDLICRHFSLLFRCTRALAAAVQPCMMHWCNTQHRRTQQRCAVPLHMMLAFKRPSCNVC